VSDPRLTPEQLDRIARIVSDSVPYIDIRSYGGGGQFDDEEWLELVQVFADATTQVTGPNATEAIVRDLAAGKPLDGEGYACGTCLAIGAEGTEGHAPDCPWLLATQWVQAHPDA